MQMKRSDPRSIILKVKGLLKLFILILQKQLYSRQIPNVSSTFIGYFESRSLAGDDKAGSIWEVDEELVVHRSLKSGRQPAGAWAPGSGCVGKL